MRGLWEDVFLSCEGSAGKSMVGHLLRDDSRIREDVPGNKYYGHALWLDSPRARFRPWSRSILYGYLSLRWALIRLGKNSWCPQVTPKAL